MFDFIMCEYPIDTHELLIKAQKGFPLQYQTKDTPDQSMSHYKIDKDGVLWKNYFENEWTKDIEHFLGGYFKTTSEEWRKESFSGEINFYEGVPHPDRYSLDQNSKDYWLRYKSGWIEFKAIFLKGYLVGEIELITKQDPTRLSDEEVEESLSRHEENRKRTHLSNCERRKEHPTPEQELIDRIYDAVVCDTETEREYYASNEYYALNKVVEYIKEYREKYDKFYEEIK
jgi:hypothetical protein